MSDKDILRVGRIATKLSIEVATAIAKATIADNLHHGLSKFEVVDRELVGIPAILCITTVGIDRAKQTIVDSYCQLMLEGVTSESSMVYLDIHLEVFIQTMSFEEANYSFCVYIILMLSRFHRLRLDEECACETFAASIVASQCKHSCKMLLFTFLVGI